MKHLITTSVVTAIVTAGITVGVIAVSERGKPKDIKVTFNGKTAEQLRESVNTAQAEHNARLTTRLEKREAALKQSEKVFSQRLAEHHVTVKTENEKLDARELAIEKNAAAAIALVKEKQAESMKYIKEAATDYKRRIDAKRPKVQRKAYTSRSGGGR